ncbi:MAG TPA: expansin EXLX1 family cellulose-binding protein [Kofleriaceae bacterium]|nr:expansin EXLX1 family cellulose-binding protein [Kofleriaceae bacterium]
MRIAGLIVIVAACGGGSHDATIDATPTSCSNPPAPESGDGTYYTFADGTGACSFDATPNDLNVAAMNSVDYANAAWCGACLDVTGPQGHVVVRVVDLCPECKHGDLDLSPQAFEQLSPLAAGRIAITWHEVPCDVSGPIAYHFKDGSNPYWTAIQIRNHRYPITKVEAKDKTGAWTSIQRLDYNFFVQASGLGDGPYSLRVTDDRGHVVEDDSVTPGDNTTTSGASQLEACPGGA